MNRFGVPELSRSLSGGRLLREPLTACSLLLDFAARNGIKDFQMPDDMVAFKASLCAHVFSQFLNAQGDTSN